MTTISESLCHAAETFCELTTDKNAEQHRDAVYAMFKSAADQINDDIPEHVPSRVDTEFIFPDGSSATISTFPATGAFSFYVSQTYGDGKDEPNWY